MKLVLLAAVIVMIAIRAVLSLIGNSPPWPTPAWDFFAAVALLATLSIAVDAARRRLPQPGPLVPPRIPLERIAPYREEAVLAHFGAADKQHIHLN